MTELKRSDAAELGLFDLVLALSLVRPSDPDDVGATRRTIALLEHLIAASYLRRACPALVTVAVEVDA